MPQEKPSDANQTYRLSTLQRVTFWVVMLVVYVGVLAQNNMSIVGTPARAAGAGIGVLLVAIFVRGWVKRKFGSPVPTPSK